MAFEFLRKMLNRKEREPQEEKEAERSELEQEVLEQEARWQHRARQALPKEAAADGLEGAGCVAVRDPEPGEAVGEAGKVPA